ncbi:MAG TPA: phosphatase PAP2 family protein [Candidatus Sulfotelmatobacter sp.]|nr:phosphatase PAP2 family protein [Candidatus Sulfotelmatobacter sp.]
MKSDNPQSVAARLRSEWRLKLVLLFILNAWIYAPYLFFQRHHYFPPTAMPLSFLDWLIPFWAETVWIYLSVYFLMPIGPFLMNRRRQIHCYAAGIALIGLIADVVFFFFPTTCPRPSAAGTNTLYQSLVGIDNPFHAFPSLHAAFAVYSARCAVMVARELNGSRLFEIGLWFWTFMILVATLTTKQHVIVDLAGGGALGYGIYSCVFNWGKFGKSPTSSLESAATNVNSNIP